MAFDEGPREFGTRPMRTCGSCSLCCKVMEIKELKKPMNKWCSHCAKGGGCSIYPTRPAECRTFDCLWLKDESFPDEFRPQRSKIVFTVEHGGGRLSAYVDASFPTAWREKRVYALLKRWSAFQAQRRRQCLGAAPASLARRSAVSSTEGSERSERMRPRY